MTGKLGTAKIEDNYRRNHFSSLGFRFFSRGHIRQQQQTGSITPAPHRNTWEDPGVMNCGFLKYPGAKLRGLGKQAAGKSGGGGV